jgi:hypothetical protein
VPGQSETFQRIDALVQIGLRLARTAPSGRLLLARVAELIEPAWLPGEWQETIGAALSAATAGAHDPIEPQRVEAVLRDAWGVKATDELDSLELEPVAVRAASQVHRGELDGRPVAVKLLRPGLAASVRQDLALLESLLAPLGAAFPALDPAGLMREFRSRILDELDLEHEAGNMRRFNRALRSHPSFRIPAPVTRLAHDGVLVSEWIDGVALNEAPDPDAACLLLVRFVIGGLRAGLVHADPDPRDVLVLADGGIAILDFGAVAEPDADRVERSAAAVEAFLAGDQTTFTDAVVTLGALPADLCAPAMTLIEQVLGEFADAEPVRLDTPAVLRLGARLDDHPREVARLLAASALPPEDLWPARGVAQLFATIARVGATGPWRDAVRDALRDGWATGE